MPSGVDGGTASSDWADNTWQMVSLQNLGGGVRLREEWLC